MRELLLKTRGPDRELVGDDGHRPTEIWPKEAKVKSGASATTKNLLLMLENLEIPLPQVEAILNGVIGIGAAGKRR